MNSHELAKKLLELPDKPVTVYDGSYMSDVCLVNDVVECEKTIHLDGSEYVPFRDR